MIKQAVVDVSLLKDEVGNTILELLDTLKVPRCETSYAKRFAIEYDMNSLAGRMLDILIKVEGFEYVDDEIQYYI